MPWRGIVVGRIEAISKIAEKALNCMGNSAFSKASVFVPKFTRAVGGILRTSKPGIRDSVSSSNYIQKTDREFIRRVLLCRCLRRALLAILAVVSLFYQDFCPQTVHSFQLFTSYHHRLQQTPLFSVYSVLHVKATYSLYQFMYKYCS